MSDDILDKIQGLIEQATAERSHYYVKAVAIEAKQKIEQLKKENEIFKKALEFYAKGANEPVKEGRSEFGCSCCAGNIDKEGNNDYDSSIVGLTAREALKDLEHEEKK